jgi:hypothetical protein
MAASLLLGALAPNVASLGLAVALYFPSSGLACGVAQVLLVQDENQRETNLTDWTLAGTLGDLATPGLFWLLAEGGFSWRWTFALVGVCVAGLAAAVPRTAARNPVYPESAPATEVALDPGAPGPDPSDENDDEPPMRDALRLVAGNRPLLWWLLATALCSLLDELFAAQLGIHLAQVLAPRDATTTVTQQLLAASIGGTLGLLVQRALLSRHRGTTILFHACVWTLIIATVWLFTLPHTVSLVCMALFGAAVATHYPLAQAQAYAALPGRPTVVAAASQAFSAVDLIYPLIVGMLSDHAAPVAGLVALLLQPAGILLVMAVTRRNERDPSTRSRHPNAAETPR